MGNDDASTEIASHDAELRHRYLERMVLLSDGVFAIAITLSALEIKPHPLPGQSVWQAWAMPLLLYFLGFILVGGAWIQHRHIMTRLHGIDRIGTVLNLLFLSFVALLPIAVRAFLEEAGSGAIIYLWVTAATYFSLALLWGYAALHAGLVAHAHRPFAKTLLLKLLAAPILVSGAYAYVAQHRYIALACAVSGAAILIWARVRPGRIKQTQSAA